MSVRVQNLTIKYVGLEKWGSLRCSVAVSSLVSIKLAHSPFALLEILGSPFAIGDHEISHIKDSHQKKNPKPKIFNILYFLSMLALTWRLPKTQWFDAI